MECHGESSVDTGHSHGVREKSVWKVSLKEYHEELVRVDVLRSTMRTQCWWTHSWSAMRSLWRKDLHTRDDGESEPPWICGESVFSE